MRVLKEATIVTTDGSMVTVKKTDDPESAKGMLFWALCVAGGGNFGIVVETKIDVQKLKNENGTVVAGKYVWYPKTEDRADMLSTMSRFYTTNWPDEMTIGSAWLMGLHKEKRLGVRFLAYVDGSERDFEKHIYRSLSNKELAKQLKR